MIGLRPLAATFGAEVTGAGIGSASAERHAGDLIAALHRHQVLLFRGQPLDPASQLRVTELFGDVMQPWDLTHAHPEDPRVEVFRGSHAREYRRPAEHWHSDASFLSEPTDVTLLHALTVPTHGGCTSFTDTRTALAELPGPLRERIEPLVAVHDFGSQFAHLREAAARVTAQAAQRERAAFRPVRHPLVREHPVAGTRALYLNELCLTHIEGITRAQSSRLLAQLYSHTLRPEWQYTHRWSVGDLLVWDNPSLLHRGQAVPHGQDRLVHRTTAAYRGKRI